MGYVGQNFGHWGYNLCGFGSSFGHGPWFLGWIVPLFFWGFIIFVIYSMVKSLFGGRDNRQTDSAMEILRNRFASGEVDEKEFDAQKAVLSKK